MTGLNPETRLNHTPNRRKSQDLTAPPNADGKSRGIRRGDVFDNQVCSLLLCPRLMYNSW